MDLSVSRHNLVSATPPTVFKRFWGNFPVIVPLPWRWSYFIEVMLNWFLRELWPFNNISTVSHVFATSPRFFKGFWWNFPVIVSLTWRRPYNTEVTLDCFLPELWLNIHVIDIFTTYWHFTHRGTLGHLLFWPCLFTETSRVFEKGKVEVDFQTSIFQVFWGFFFWHLKASGVLRVCV